MILNKLARYAIILIIVIVAAVQLPVLYYKLVHKPTGSPRIYYSSINHDFLYLQYRNGRVVFTDPDDTRYTRKEFEKALPFTFYRDLNKWGVLPDTIQGLAIDASVIHHNSDRYRLRGKDLDLVKIPLYPLFESESEFANLHYPPNFFRFGEKIEFITAKTNKIDKDLTEKFNIALQEKGFNFPAQLVAGNPTTRKPFDEGYFVVDSKGFVFHMKKVKGEPWIVKTPVKNDLNIKKITLQESVARKVYGFLITEENDFFMISYDNYQLLPVELENYRADEMDITITVNPLYAQFNYDDNYNFYSAVYDSNYQYIDKLYLKKPGKDTKISEQVKHAVFPFSIKTTKAFSSLKHFSLEIYSSLSVIGIVLSLIIGFMVKIKRREDIGKNWFDFVIIALTGIYGLLAVVLIKSDIWE
ncbi:MAG: DUF4857 domain-containing protein [Fidelibacterota bacterium]